MINAIISVYMPGKDALNNVKEISLQADCVYVCDNSPHSNPEFACIGSNVRYVKNEKNLGLPEAFNRVLKDESIGWKSNDFVIFFDQDSQIEKNHIERLVNEYREIEKSGFCIGCLGPQIKEKENISSRQYQNGYLITSSMLVRYGILKEIGFWNDEFFLDLADWDLCFRIKRAGYMCVMSGCTSMKHSFGIGIKKKFGIRVRVGNPIREYYEARDALRLLFKAYTPLKYRMKLIMQVTVRPIIHLLVLSDRRQRAGFFFDGIKDYFVGKTGEYNYVL